jgi:hypothetical protein
MKHWVRERSENAAWHRNAPSQMRTLVKIVMLGFCGLKFAKRNAKLQL